MSGYRDLPEDVDVGGRQVLSTDRYSPLRKLPGSLSSLTDHRTRYGRAPGRALAEPEGRGTYRREAQGLDAQPNRGSLLIRGQVTEVTVEVMGRGRGTNGQAGSGVGACGDWAIRLSTPRVPHAQRPIGGRQQTWSPILDVGTHWRDRRWMFFYYVINKTLDGNHETQPARRSARYFLPSQKSRGPIPFHAPAPSIRRVGSMKPDSSCPAM